jgi:hypothetical protein
MGHGASRWEVEVACGLLIILMLLTQPHRIIPSSGIKIEQQPILRIGVGPSALASGHSQPLHNRYTRTGRYVVIIFKLFHGPRPRSGLKYPLGLLKSFRTTHFSEKQPPPLNTGWGHLFTSTRIWFLGCRSKKSGLDSSQKPQNRSRI